MTWRQRCERAPNARDFRAAWDEFRPKLVAFEELLAAVMDVANNDIANGVTDARQLATVSPGLRDPDLPSRGHRDVAPPGRQAADLQERVEVVSCTPKASRPTSQPSCPRSRRSAARSRPPTMLSPLPSPRRLTTIE